MAFDDEVDMPTKSNQEPTRSDAEISENEVIRALETEVRALRQRVEHRELALALLNRRLLELERSEVEMLREENVALGHQLATLRLEGEALRQQIVDMHATKLYRWSSPARGLYAKARTPH
jgi:hypothetical protein